MSLPMADFFNSYRRVDRAKLHRDNASVSKLPGDILLEISHWLTYACDILHLGLVSTHFYASIVPALYSSVHLHTLEQCLVTLKMLSSSRLNIAGHVRRLSIQLASSSSNSRHLFTANALASAAVRDIAGSKRLKVLKSFIWNDDELPFHDDMWFAIRLGCPLLSHLKIPFGRFMPHRSSHLYDFANLKGFSLFLKPDFYTYNVDAFFPDEAFSDELWEMLRRCPNLEELEIVGMSSIPADIHQVTSNRWPKLQRLHFGDVCVDWLPGPSRKRPLINFLEAHSSLTSLGLSRHSVQPHHLGTIDPDILRINSFSGSLQQLQSLPHELFSKLTCLTFSEPLQTREVNGFTLAGILQTLSSLRELKVSFSLHSMYYDSGNLLRSLITGAPQLQHLELACMQRPSFQIETFAKTIRGFPKLRSLHLMIVRYPGDDSLSSAATCLARLNPRIRRFSLTYLPSSGTAPAPFGSFSSEFNEGHPALSHIPAKATGTFAITTDAFGLPLRLTALVRSKLTWPLGLGESSQTRRYVSDLRPHGTPGAETSSFSKLVFERSAAGDEVRLLIFCSAMVILAVIGFLGTAAASYSDNMRTTIV